MARISKRGLAWIGVGVAALAAIITVAVVTYVPRSSILKIYNWEDYISASSGDVNLITEFEKHYREVSGDSKFRVQYDTFTDNEELFTKLDMQKSDFDIAFPSEYMVEKLIDKNLLSEIDTAEIENYNSENLDGVVLSHADTFSKDADGKLYAIPYMYGTLGIMYDTDVIDAMEPTTGISSAEFLTGLETHGWGALFGEGDFHKYKSHITMKKSARDTIGIAMLYANKGDTNYQAILNMVGDDYPLSEAEAALRAQITSMYPTYENDAGKQAFANPDDSSFAFGLYWSCDAGLIMYEDDGETPRENIRFFVPEGTNLWMDNFVMPKYAGGDKDAAYAFINFMLDKGNAQTNMEYVGSAMPVVGAVEGMKDPEDYGAGDDHYDRYIDTMIPDSTLMTSGSAIMKDFDDATETAVTGLMTEIMHAAASADEGGDAGGNGVALWVILGVAVVGGVGFLIYWLPRRRKLR